MNKIVKSFQENTHCSDLLHEIYGISSAEHFDCVFIAPSWPIDKVFDSATTDITEIYSDRFSKSHRIKHNSKSYLYIQLQVGAPNIVDFCFKTIKKIAGTAPPYSGNSGAFLPAK